MPKKKAAFDSLFVPEEEQPYPIPENWCWTYLSCVAQWGSGGTPSRKILAYYDGEISWIKTGELNDELIYESEEHISSEAIANSSAKLFPIHTVIIAMYGATIGKVGILEIEAATNQACACAVSSTAIDYKYLFYYAKSQKEAFIKKGKGGAQPNISQEIIKTHEIPLPPLPEQHRIVNCIESLFAKLDEAKEKAQTVVDGVELRKSAILHKAFTGELTERWRKEHGVGMDSWETKTSKELFEYVTSGSRGWAQYYSETGAVFVRMGNLDHGTIELDFSDIQHVCLPDKAEGQRSRLQNNDILISITADVGMVGLVREMDFEAYINQHIALARPNNENDSEFIAWYLVSDVGLKQMQGKQRGATKVGLGLDDIRSLQLSMPKISEQKKVVAVLNKLMNKEQQAKEAAETVLDQIDTMEKAILAHAFRGKLGTNDPAEEWAGEMVKAVL